LLSRPEVLGQHASGTEFTGRDVRRDPLLDIATSDIATSDIATSDIATSDIATSDIATSDIAASDIAASDIAASTSRRRVASGVGLRGGGLSVGGAGGDGQSGESDGGRRPREAKAPLPDAFPTPWESDGHAENSVVALNAADNRESIACQDA
jgi:hypothetical protein